MTLGEIRERILDGLNESPTDPVFWTAAEMTALIQDGMAMVAEEAQAIKRTAFTALRPGSTYYATRGIAPDLMVPTRLWLPHLNRRLTATTTGQLDCYHERWQTVSGEPEYWFPMGWDWFGVFPHPTTGGGVLRVDYLAWPRTFLDDDDEPEFLGADHEGLVPYGMYEGHLKRWNIEEALFFFNVFLEHYGLSRARSNERPTQARTWQKSTSPGPGYRTGEVGNRYGD